MTPAFDDQGALSPDGRSLATFQRAAPAPQTSGCVTSLRRSTGA